MLREGLSSQRRARIVVRIVKNDLAARVLELDRDHQQMIKGGAHISMSLPRNEEQHEPPATRTKQLSAEGACSRRGALCFVHESWCYARAELALDLPGFVKQPAEIVNIVV